MASEINQVNGVEPSATEIRPKPSPVKQIGTVINEFSKGIETKPNQNGASNNAVDHSASAGKTEKAAPSSKTVEPKGSVVEPVGAPPVATPTASKIEPMETDQLSTPPQKVKEKPKTDGVDVADSSKSEEKVEEKTALVDQVTKTDAKETKEVGSTAEKPVDEPVPESSKKPGRKPGGRPKKAVTEKPSSNEAKEPIGKQEEASSDETPAKIEQATTASVKRTPRKKRESAAGDADGEKTPLLDTPLVIEGKRSRQKTDRLDTSDLSASKREKEVNIVSDGPGVKLGDISHIETMISKTSPGDLRLLHRIAFGKVGVANEVKKHLRLFNGFGFAANSSEYDKKRKFIESLAIADLKFVCDILGLEKSGKKEDFVEAVCNFCASPSNRGNAQTGKGSPSPGKRKAGPGRKGKKAAAAAESATEDDEEKPEEESAEPVQPLPAKRGRPSKTAASPKVTPAKRAAPASASPTRSAKKPAFPTDGDIKSIIKDLLKGVNLEEVTMKEMTAKVYEKYPGVDLTSKKDFIKDTVKSLLSASD